MKGLERKEQIENFCTDLKLIWSRQYPELTFGDIVNLLAYLGVTFKREPEILDMLMDLNE